MNVYLLFYLIECTCLHSAPRYCVTCKYFKSHFPYSKDYLSCPMFPKEIVTKEITYNYCFRKCNCELFKDSLFSLMK